MPSWQAIVVFCFALATTMTFKFILPEPERGDTAIGEMDSRIARLKRYRMEHGTCVSCGEPLPHGSLTGTATSLVCPHCASVSDEDAA